MPSSSRSRLLAVLLAAVVLIGGANLAAYAANGQPLLLGKTGVATKKTTLKNTGSGPGLHVKTQPGQAPFKVNRTKKVNRLNADLVDGHSAVDLETKVWVFDVSTPPGQVGVTSFALPGLPAGDYVVSYTVGVLPSAVPAWFACWVWGAGAEPAALALADYQTGYGHVSAAGFVRVVDTSTFTCQQSNNTYEVLDSPYPSKVTFTRVDQAVEETVVGSRGTAGSGGRAGR